jgi:hypothetical protein
MADRAVAACDQCGQVDDHPKVHMQGLVDGVAGIISKHHDCLSVHEERALEESGQEPGHVKASAVIRECKAGRRGDKLLAFITGEHKKADLAVGAAHQRQLEADAANREADIARCDRVIADSQARLAGGEPDPDGDLQDIIDWATAQRNAITGSGG